MSLPLYCIVRVLIAFLQALPLRVVARLGRMGGGFAWSLNLRFRRVALQNLAAAFPEKSKEEIFQTGRENMRRIGENYASAVKTASMSFDELRKVCQVAGLEKLPQFGKPDSPRNCVVAIGHFGNFELFAILAKLLPKAIPATTYRGLKEPRLAKLLQSLRERSGCQFFERRTEAAALKQALNKGGVLLGLLSDQHVSGGVWGPFLGRACGTTSAPALFALRYEAPLFTAICYRTELGRWRIDVGDEIPTRLHGATRSTEEITGDINRAFEAAVRRDPANWFWVHNRWKPKSRAANPKAQGVPPGDLKAEPAPL